jgi:hypothetical protein
MKKNFPKTLQAAIIYFATYENCHEFMVSLRWPDGKVICPRCGCDKVTYLEKARVWKCYGKHDRPKFSLKVGTIFEDSPIGLDKWLAAVWMVVNCKNGISSYEIARGIGVTQKSAWFMDHRIRFALHQGSFSKLSGEVEADETFIGGKSRNMHRSERARKITGTGGMGKAAVMGLLERHSPEKKCSTVRLKVVENTRKKLLQPEVRAHVEAGSSLFTDALLSYSGLSSDYAHEVIDHAECYVRENVHTNGLENFWSLLKRSIKGTYVSVEPFHLFRYLDEQAFRFNERAGNDAYRFQSAMEGIVEKRLTYKSLTGKEGESTSIN